METACSAESNHPDLAVSMVFPLAGGTASHLLAPVGGGTGNVHRSRVLRLWSAD